MAIGMSQPSCSSWLERHRPLASAGNISDEFRLWLPADSGRLAALSGWIVSSLPATGEALLMVTQTGVWESGEVPELFAYFRKGLGITEGLEAMPGQLHTLGDKDELRCSLVLCLWNHWDCQIVDGQGRFGLTASHDEWLILAANAENRSMFRLVLDAFGGSAGE